MELTNLIWHLGALLASLWAAFSYRSLLVRQKELEEGVLASLLESRAEMSTASDDLGSPRHLALQRSVRTRALRWYSDEFTRRCQVSITWQNMSSLLTLPDHQWRRAVTALQFLLVEQKLPLEGAVTKLKLTWKSEDDGLGKWVSADVLEN